MRNTKLMAGLVFAALVGMFMAPGQAFAGKYHGTFFDMATNVTTFVADDAPLRDDGFPDHGNTFIVEGYLYPGGLLTSDDGILPDGSPEYPDQVIGTWRCRGWFLDDGLTAVSGPFAATNQTFYFDNGGDLIATDGLEIAGQAFRRAISGGVGNYEGMKGEALQEAIGTNATGGHNIRFRMFRTW